MPDTQIEYTSQQSVFTFCSPAGLSPASIFGSRQVLRLATEEVHFTSLLHSGARESKLPSARAGTGCGCNLTVLLKMSIIKYLNVANLEARKNEFHGGGRCGSFVLSDLLEVVHP